ncbi:phytanoyl-CoA dioxygenase family protein [Pseudomonas sp. SWI44]|uniref:phytanoyl-CoA dioxygenase family protein n=1 Tax=Pseudomonas sp. SWI44 TaxID=2083053 RepID=UPI000CE5F9BB|nr:phytanoyl-CoA dioxygenase family protein [Pseudomonas sp. SWI44]AVD89986.1 phytanoyl-CoA dioxygenase [Pseudomonas sp. SWI44]
MSKPSLVTLPRSASVDQVVEIIERDGGVIIADFLDADAFKELKQQIDAALDTSIFGHENFFVGTSTRRASRLFARCRRMVDVVMHPLYLGAARKILQKPIQVWFGQERTTVTPQIQIGMTQAIQIHPGQGKQPLHRDDTSFLWRHPNYGREARLQIMVAMTEFTEANGATKVIPGSHKWDDERCPSPEETVDAEMAQGSALLFIGSTYHGGGTNSSDKPRTGLTMGIDLGCVRQEENQYLSVPFDTLKELPEDVQRLLGWDAGENFMGWVEHGGKMVSPQVHLQADDVAQSLGLVKAVS